MTIDSSVLPFPLIAIGGAPFERGHAYGETARDRITLALSFYGSAFEATSGISFGTACDRVADRCASWEAAAPDLMAEVRGIAAGSGFGVDEILALNCRDVYMHRGSLATDPDAFDDGCTSFVVLQRASRDGHVLTGQTWDYLEPIQDTIVVLHVEATDRTPAQVIVVEAGQVGRHGANGAGVGLHANGLPGAAIREDALPTTFLRRRITESAGFAEALATTVRPPRARHGNLLLSSRDGIAIDIEARLETVRWIHPVDGVLAHANHYQAEIPPELADTYTPLADSLVRFARADDGLRRAASSGGVGLADLAAISRDHAGGGDSVCTHADPDKPDTRRWATVSSTITDLTEGTMFIAAGPPCRNDYIPIDIATGRIAPPAESLAPSAPPPG